VGGAGHRGDRIVLVGPRRGLDFGGIEFDPGAAAAEGAAFLEVPVAGDVLDVDAPGGVEVYWLPRAGAAHGSLLTAAVVAHLGAPVAPAEVPDHEVDPDLWETSSYSTSGERLPEDASGPDGLYAWIAGESGVVTGLRRYLVRELGVDRRQVAFMATGGAVWRCGPEPTSPVEAVGDSAQRAGHPGAPGLARQLRTSVGALVDVLAGDVVLSQV